MARSDSKKPVTTLRSVGRISKPVDENSQRPSELQRPTESSSTRPARPSEVHRPTESSSTRPARPSELQRPRPATRPSTSVRPSSDSSSTPTVTKVVKKTDTKVTTKIEKISHNFSIYGNRGGVKVINEKLKYKNIGTGDGDIYHEGTKIIRVTATPDSVAYNPETGYATAKVTIRLEVWEKDFAGKKSRDYLSMEQQIVESKFVGKGITSEGIGTQNKDNTYSGYKYVEKSATPFALTKNYEPAIYISDYHGSKGFQDLSPDDYPELNRHQDWMAIEDIRVQANADGSELHGQDNLAITGCFNFYFKVVTKTWSEYSEEITTMNKPRVTTTQGPYDKQPQETLDSIKEVVGNGYDITGSYTDTSSVKHSVLALDKINDLKRLKVTKQRPFIQRSSIEGESLEEFSSKLEESLNVKVSFSGFGAAFSSDTKTTSTTEKSISENRRFVKFTSMLKNKEYDLLLDYKNNLNTELLQPTFLNDLNTSDPDTIIENYGTHVILGAVYGASASYNMSYVKSVSNITKARTFENTTSIGYNSAGGTEGGKKKEENKKSTIAQLVDELGGIEKLSDKQFEALLNAYKFDQELQNKAKDASKNDSKSSGSGSKPSGCGFNVSTSYSESETTSNSFENTTTESKGIAYGGDWDLGSAIRKGELDKIPEWESSADPRSNDPLINHQWCDFIPGRLVPIYEFVPAGYKVTAEKLRQAWTSYIARQGMKLTPTKQSIIQVPGGINVKGDKKTVKSLNSDREVSTSKNKETGWKVRFELVNLENGNVAVVVQLTVGEDGLDGNRTLMMLHYPIEVTNPYGGTAVIDTTRYNCIYETQGSIYRQEHNLFDVTRFFLDCPFLDFEHHSDNKVYISVDGGGDDSSHIRIQVKNFYVPVLVDVKD